MSKFNLDHQYQLYLERVKLSEDKMSEVQKQETKRAFMGACGQMLILLRDDLAELEDLAAFNQYRDMINQVQNFWIKENNQMN